MIDFTKLCFEEVKSIYTFSKNDESACFPTPFLKPCVRKVFDLRQSSMFKLVSHCSFNLFLWVRLSIFACTYKTHLYFLCYDNPLSIPYWTIVILLGCIYVYRCAHTHSPPFTFTLLSPICAKEWFAFVEILATEMWLVKS